MRTCPRCQHVSPAEAAFCWFDGLDLRMLEGTVSSIPLAVPVEGGPLRLPHEFGFSSGRRCATYDEFVQGCLAEWPSACGLLRDGTFRSYFTSIGRLDLARAADEAAQQSDADLALDTFLGRLPATRLPRPELELQPRKLLVGTLAVGETRQVQLVVQNIGSGLLHGSVSIVDGGGWLRFAGPKANGAVKLKLAREQTILFDVDPRGLPAPTKCAARLHVITNGGIVEVPVRLDLTPLPFMHRPYLGASSPRDLAVLIRNNPRPAIPLLESGEVARWFASNGWAYPVIGATAPGMAAVQQFFESLGLAKPPRVGLAEPVACFECLRGEHAQGQACLTTSDKKWIYAEATANVSWLQVRTPSVSGPQRAGVDFEIDTQSLKPNRSHEGTLQIVANGGQRLSVRVVVDVRRPERAPLRGWLVRPVLLGALSGLLLRLLLAGPADVYARVIAAAPDAVPVAGSIASWGGPPGGTEFIRHFVLASWWLGALMGGVLVVRRGRLLDFPFGVLAGAAAGVALMATVACGLPALDWLPRWLWHYLDGWLLLAGFGESIALTTGAWVLVAVACWTLAGAVLGLVRACLVPGPDPME